MSNPVRISRIGTDHIQVFIRPAHGSDELLALVERLEQLIDAGYDTVEVIFEGTTSGRLAAPVEPSTSVRWWEPLTTQESALG